MSNYLWILDAGHGGIIDGVYQTDGKRSPVWPDGRQLFEGEFNRDIVDRVATLLDFVNVDYIKLIDTQKDISLKTRKNKANKIFVQDPRAVLVSIHANAGGGTGWEVFTSPRQTPSDIIAKIFYEVHEEDFSMLKFRADWSDDDPDKEAKFYMLTKTKCPAILTENFFMDTLNPDCELLMSEIGRDRIAMAHYRAILKCEATTPI